MATNIRDQIKKEFEFKWAIMLERYTSAYPPEVAQEMIDEVLGDLDSVISLVEKETTYRLRTKYDRKTNKTPRRKQYIRHRYHQRVGKIFEDCQLCVLCGPQLLTHS